MAKHKVQTYDAQGNLVNQEEVDLPDAPVVPAPATIDRTKLANARTQLASANSVASLRAVVQALVDALDPSNPV